MGRPNESIKMSKGSSESTVTIDKTTGTNYYPSPSSHITTPFIQQQAQLHSWLAEGTNKPSSAQSNLAAKERLGRIASVQGERSKWLWHWHASNRRNCTTGTVNRNPSTRKVIKLGWKPRTLPPIACQQSWQPRDWALLKLKPKYHPTPIVFPSRIL